MRNFIINISIFLFLFSCNDRIQEKENTISIAKIKNSLIEVNRNQANIKLKNGVLYIKETPFSGIVNTFYADGNIKAKAAYDQGKREGFFWGWYRNGKQWFKRSYIKGLKAGIHKGWHENGARMFEYHFNNKGVYNGAVKDWFANGALAKHFNFVGGKEAGSQKMWDLKGKIRANFYTVNAERHGLIGLKKCISVLHKETE